MLNRQKWINLPIDKSKELEDNVIRDMDLNVNDRITTYPAYFNLNYQPETQT